MKILLTGSAGFIGYHLSISLVKRGFDVISIDNINEYYDINLKYSRLYNLGFEKEDLVKNKLVESKIYNKKLFFAKIDICNNNSLNSVLNNHSFDLIIHLAAQAGVRYSLENPQAYIDSNIQGFFNILEYSRKNKIDKLLYASSSSVYGNNSDVPYKESDQVDKPISLYAATKKSNELLAHSYSNLFKIKSVGLRFFTVYGPWGRPDMAPMLFANALFRKRKIKIFNNGDLHRDFTFIDDIINGINKIIDNLETFKIYEIVNIGRGSSIKLMDFVNEFEKIENLKFSIEYKEMQPGDVYRTWSDSNKLNSLGYKPVVDLEKGMKVFLSWYKKYYNL